LNGSGGGLRLRPRSVIRSRRQHLPRALEECAGGIAFDAVELRALLGRGTRSHISASWSRVVVSGARPCTVGGRGARSAFADDPGLVMDAGGDQVPRQRQVSSRVGETLPRLTQPKAGAAGPGRLGVSTPDSGACGWRNATDAGLEAARRQGSVMRWRPSSSTEARSLRGLGMVAPSAVVTRKRPRSTLIWLPSVTTSRVQDSSPATGSAALERVVVVTCDGPRPGWRCGRRRACPVSRWWRARAHRGCHQARRAPASGRGGQARRPGGGLQSAGAVGLLGRGRESMARSRRKV